MAPGGHNGLYAGTLSVAPASTCALRHVGCNLTFEVGQGAVLAVQVAPAKTAGELLDERIAVTIDDQPLSPSAAERNVGHHGRVHLLHPDTAGTLTISYAATLRPPRRPAPQGTTPTGDALGFETESLLALRQSRYCPSDAMAGFARGEMANLEPGSDLARSVASWVFERLAYANSSDQLDTAIDTLLSGAGVCRDFAHLTIALCRALGVPARFVSVYAPGLSPMQFHAVVEARGDNGWEVLDPTRLAPRLSLVRIATGRDAADASFATTLRGEAELVSSDVVAVVDGDLPFDDHFTPVSLP